MVLALLLWIVRMGVDPTDSIRGDALLGHAHTQSTATTLGGIATMRAEAATSQSQKGFLIQYDWGASRVGNCPYWATSMQRDCHWDSYRTRLLTWAMPNVALGGVLFISVVVYLLCRYILDCCGGRRSAPNFCLPNYFLLSRYSKGDLLRPLLWCLAAAACAFAVLIWGGTNATALRQSMRDMRQSAQQTVGVLETMASRLGETMREVEYVEVTDTGDSTRTAVWSGETTALQAAVAAVSEQLAWMEALSTGALVPFVTRHLWAAYTIEVLTFLSCVLGVLAAMCHCTGQLPMLVCTLLCVLGTLTWCYSGFLIASSHLLEDSCREVSYFTAHQTNVLRVVTNCTAAASAAATLSADAWSDSGLRAATPTHFDLLKGAYWRQVESFSNASCTALRRVCPAALSLSFQNLLGDEDDGGESACDSMTVSQLRTALRQAVMSSSSSSSSSSSGAASCGRQGDGTSVPLTEPERASLQSRLDALNRLLSRLTLWSPVTSCDGVLALAVPPLLQTCVTGIEHQKQLVWSCGVLGWCSLVGMFAAAMGSKRFLPLRTALEAVIEEEGEG